jgi:hypothetical protein
VITVDERYSRPSPVSDQERHTTWGVSLPVRTIPSAPGNCGVASAADAVVGVTMTSSRFSSR